MLPNLTQDEVINSAKNCKGCKKECLSGCSLMIDIPNFIKSVKKKDFKGAYKILKAKNPFPSITGRICKAACETACPNDVKIKAIQRYIGDMFENKLSNKKSSKNKIAIIGSGMAGLTSSLTLMQKGHNVTLFEALPSLGGSMFFRVPDFRLSQEVIDKDIIFSKNIEIRTNSMIGATIELEQLSKSYDAVIIATGANKPAFMNIPGENLINVFTLNELMSLEEYPNQNSKTIVLGGNFSALDAALIASSKGDEVYVVFEKSFEDLEVDKETIDLCRAKGVNFLFLTKPTKLIGNGAIEKIEFKQMMIRQDDGIRRPYPIEDSEFEMECNKVVLSVGYEPNPTIGNCCNIRTSGKGRLWVNPNYQTNIKNVFASGELLLGNKSASSIIKNAMSVADNVDMFLRGKLKEYEDFY